MTFTVVPWAHLELTGKSDPSVKATCDAPCTVSLAPGVYTVRATNDRYRETDFEITVEAGKSDSVYRAFDGFNAEAETNRVLASLPAGVSLSRPPEQPRREMPQVADAGQRLIGPGAEAHIFGNAQTEAAGQASGAIQALHVFQAEQAM